MINEEILSVVANNVTSITVARGCCDTIPQEHASGSTIWFFDDSINSDLVEYAGNETLGVKVLPKTLSGGAVPIANADPIEITFGFRFIRPYPPGLVEINGDPWFQSFELSPDILEFVISWAHRNRVTQGDTLVDHLSASVTPEVGTTYRLRVFTAADELVRSITGITGDTLTYTHVEALVDFDAISVGHISAYMLLDAVRDGYTSWQGYRIDFVLDTSPPYVPRRLEDNTIRRLESGANRNLEN